ncbi:MAG: glycosyltransferase family 2 protein [Bacteroidaceae bacterium]|jgi:glycosyltransferase involved in cell wall biosynthesis
MSGNSLVEPRISAVLNTFNAAEHLEQVLHSLERFDEIVICDMYSEDDTLRIAERFGARVVMHERCTICEPARNAAIRAARYPWVLIVDADEIVPDELRKYLYELVKRPDAPAALRLPRKNYFMGRFMKCLYPDYITRFARRDSIDWPATIHAQPRIEGRVETVPKERGELAFVHLADNSIAARLRKTDLYTDQEVGRRGARSYGLAAFCVKPFFRFFHTYVQKGGFRDGIPGLIWAMLDAYYKFVTLAKQEEQSRL